MKILALENTVSERKFLERLNGRGQMTEKRVCELEARHQKFYNLKKRLKK